MVIIRPCIMETALGCASVAILDQSLRTETALAVRFIVLDPSIHLPIRFPDAFWVQMHENGKLRLDEQPEH